MRVLVEHIPPDGLPVHLDPAAAWLQEAASVALECPARAIGGALRVERFGKRLEVVGTLSAETDTTCDRCLAPLRLRPQGRSQSRSRRSSWPIPAALPSTSARTRASL